MSSSSRLQVASLVVIALAGCARGTASVDAPPPRANPRNPKGVFAVTSALDIRLPAATQAAIATLTIANSGPDEPTRYLLDHMIEALADGTLKTLARDAAPLVAAFLDDKVSAIAPRFLSGLQAIARGLTTIAERFGTVETLRVADTGEASRTVTAARFTVGSAPIDVGFGDHGLADLVVTTRVTIDPAGRFAIPTHSFALPYGALMRLGLDHAVIPSVVPAATELTTALRTLVDCGMLGQLVYDYFGLGSPALYAAACEGGMNAIATDLYARLAALDATPTQLEVSGAGEGIDLDGDGLMDELRAGVWTGTLEAAGTREPINPSTFVGTKAP